MCVSMCCTVEESTNENKSFIFIGISIFFVLQAFFFLRAHIPRHTIPMQSIVCVCRYVIHNTIRLNFTYIVILYVTLIYLTTGRQNYVSLNIIGVTNMYVVLHKGEQRSKTKTKSDHKYTMVVF